MFAAGSVLLAGALAAVDPSQYTGKSDVPSLGMSLHWKVDNDTVQIGIVTSVSAWVGFGVADMGGMPGADVVYVAQAANGSAFVQDGWAHDRAYPGVDGCQDWELVSAEFAGGTQVELRRRLDTGDPQDRPIRVDGLPTRVILATGADGTLAFGYHYALRQTHEIDFASNGNASADHFAHLRSDPSVQQVLYGADNYTIPTKGYDGVGTTYAEYCFDTSGLDLGHIVGIEQLVSAAAKPHFHHTIVSAFALNTVCSDKAADGSPDLPTLVFAWAPGNKGLLLPDVAGIRVGGGLAAVQGIGVPDASTVSMTIRDKAHKTAILKEVDNLFVGSSAGAQTRGPGCTDDLWEGGGCKNQGHCFAGACKDSRIGDCALCFGADACEPCFEGDFNHTEADCECGSACTTGTCQADGKTCSAATPTCHPKSAAMTAAQKQVVDTYAKVWNEIIPAADVAGVVAAFASCGEDAGADVDAPAEDTAAGCPAQFRYTDPNYDSKGDVAAFVGHAQGFVGVAGAGAIQRAGGELTAGARNGSTPFMFDWSIPAMNSTGVDWGEFGPDGKISFIRGFFGTPPHPSSSDGVAHPGQQVYVSLSKAGPHCAAHMSALMADGWMGMSHPEGVAWSGEDVCALLQGTALVRAGDTRPLGDGAVTRYYFHHGGSHGVDFVEQASDNRVVRIARFVGAEPPALPARNVTQQPPQQAPAGGVQAGCPVQVWEACKQAAPCFGECWNRWASDGCKACYGAMMCAKCYSTTLGEAHDVLSKCQHRTITVTDADGVEQPRVPFVGLASLFTDSDTWDVIKFPVTVKCMEAPLLRFTNVAVQSAADLKAMHDAGNLSAVAHCADAAGQPCHASFSGAMYRPLLNWSGDAAWPPSWLASSSFPLTVSVGAAHMAAPAVWRGLRTVMSLQVQVHYDNPRYVSGVVDTSAIRLFVSKNLRQHDAGFFQIGDPAVLGPGTPVLPKGVSRDFFTCDSLGDCPNAAWEHDSVTAFYSLLHMHQGGKFMTGRQTRSNQTVLAHTADYYDYASQSAIITPEWTIQRADSFQVDCTMVMKKDGYYGAGSADEMCIWFIGYYPKLANPLSEMCGPGTACSSGPSDSFRTPIAKEADLHSASTAGGTPRWFGSVCDAAATPSPPADTPRPQTPQPPARTVPVNSLVKAQELMRELVGTNVSGMVCEAVGNVTESNTGTQTYSITFAGDVSVFEANRASFSQRIAEHLRVPIANIQNIRAAAGSFHVTFDVLGVLQTDAPAPGPVLTAASALSGVTTAVLVCVAVCAAVFA